MNDEKIQALNEAIATVEGKMAELDRMVAELQKERGELQTQRAQLRAERTTLDGGDGGAISRYLAAQKAQRARAVERQNRVTETLAGQGLTREDLAPVVDPIDRPKPRRKG